ncbi:hypothetical protein [Jannaschia sp. R86511]|uniref:hypothetical protein n=1 Tax=Jannaschia sp. R86511 TaxID=3093853 RepID=UPI0036D39B85
MRTSRTTVLALAVAATLTLGGCTLSGSDPDPTPPTEGEAVGSEQPSTAPSADPTPQGPTPEQISADLLEQAAAEPGQAVGSQTVEVLDNANNPVPVTVEVVSLERTRDATHLLLRLSSTESVGSLDQSAFSDRGTPNREFFDRFGLEDTENGVRHYPLSWLRPSASESAPPDGPPNSCLCPYRGQSFTLSQTPLLMDVLYGPLPEDVTTVDLVAPGDLSIPGLTIEPAAG